MVDQPVIQVMTSGAAVVARVAGSPFCRHPKDGPHAVDTALTLLPARHVNDLVRHYLWLVFP